MKSIVLIGLGHAHLEVIARAQSFRDANLKLTLIDPGTFWYSSMGVGLVTGKYTRQDDTIDSSAFCAAHAVEYVSAKAVAIDRTNKTVRLDNGQTVPYDIVSFNTGSTVIAPFEVDPAIEHRVITAKPIGSLIGLGAKLVADRQKRVRVVTIGGNYTGTEMTCNVAALLAAKGIDYDISLVTPSRTVLDGQPARASSLMEKRLSDWGVTTLSGQRVARLEARDNAGSAQLEDGRQLPFDFAIVATGLSAQLPSIAPALDADTHRGLGVTPALHAREDPTIFAAGDCANIAGYKLPKIGVFGVRAAPILAQNLVRAATGEPLAEYKPQTNWFSAINCGDGTAIGMWGPFAMKNWLMMQAKHFNDLHFMRRYKP